MQPERNEMAKKEMNFMKSTKSYCLSASFGFLALLGMTFLGLEARALTTNTTTNVLFSTYTSTNILLNGDISDFFTLSNAILVPKAGVCLRNDDDGLNEFLMMQLTNVEQMETSISSQN